MKTNTKSFILIVITFSLVLANCAAPTPDAAHTEPPVEVDFKSTEPQPSPSSTSIPEGNTLVVTSPGDIGPGTLREAIESAVQYDDIIFDPLVFPPDAPVVINVKSALPFIETDYLTLDASMAGVILDGSEISGDWVAGLQIVSSNNNIIQGLQVSNFSGPGIAISGSSRNNRIGGDRNLGDGPFGQGNMLTGNAIGVDMSTQGATQNSVTGNFIGTDPEDEEDIGNRRNGVWISEGANKNTIGPDNTIAYNHGPGIAIEHSDTLNNTITQNSIHSNGGRDIVLIGGGNAILAAPAILDHDIPRGTASGVTCANCIVEIFSDRSESGALFEGQTIADNHGSFTLDKGASFEGPYLTATNTDPDGNTSAFSLPTFEATGALNLQQGNEHPSIQLQPKQSKELEYNRIGAQWDSFGTPELYDLGIYGLGVTRARVAIAGLEPELVDWNKPEFSIDPSHDAVFDRLSENGITVTYVMIFWDKDTYPGGEGAPCARFKTEGEIERYLEFARFTINHFKDRVQYFEIWNEADIRNYCPKWIEAGDYINLVKQVVPVLKSEFPGIKITVGGGANTAFPDAYNFLFDILDSDIMPLADVIAWHPMYGTSPAFDIYREYYYGYPEMIQNIKDVAHANGFEGEFQADEIGWATEETAVADQPWVYSPIVALKYYGRGILIHLGLDVGVGLGDPPNLVRNLLTIIAGAKAESLPIQIQSEATNIVYYTFKLSNGDYLIALWADGIAVENDPGIDATVSIPGFPASKVYGTDILYGFEQELITEIVNGNLTISNLIVRDYPLILRLSEN